jgi:predicted nuclease with TOPRIM domain
MSDGRKEPTSITLLLDLTEGIAELRGKVDNLTGKADEAAEERKNVADKLERVNSRLGKLDITAATVTRMEPIVADYSKLRENVNGGLVVIAALGALLFTAIGFVLKDLWGWLAAFVRTRG